VPNFNRYIEISRALFDIKNHSARTFHTTFIIKNGKIQVIGINSLKTNTRSLRLNYFKNGEDLRKLVGTHSELSALIKYGKEDCSNCIFLNVRIDKEGNIKNSFPCNGCLSGLFQVGFKRLYFTNDSGDFEEYLSK